jgi:hypothetical protein
MKTMKVEEFLHEIPACIQGMIPDPKQFPIEECGRVLIVNDLTFQQHRRLWLEIACAMAPDPSEQQMIASISQAATLKYNQSRYTSYSIVHAIRSRNAFTGKVADSTNEWGAETADEIELLTYMAKTPNGLFLIGAIEQSCAIIDPWIRDITMERLGIDVYPPESPQLSAIETAIVHGQASGRFSDPEDLYRIANAVTKIFSLMIYRNEHSIAA